MKPRGPVRILFQAVSVTTLGVLPAFLVGALAVQIRRDLEIGPAAIGLAAATLFTVTGLLARPGGAFVQRIGAGWGMALTGLLAAVALAAVGLAPSYAVIVVGLVVGGVANAVSQPAANLSLSRAVGSARLGLAFGVKQSSIPAATLLGGLAVPGIALVLGWRWAFGLAAGTAVVVAVFAALDARRRVDAVAVDEAADVDRGTPRGGLLVLTVGAGLAAAAANSLGVFLVDSAVRAGLHPGTAGLVFAGAALFGILIRIGLGAMLDRHPGRSPYLLIANLLTAGTGGYLLLGWGSTPLVVLGAFVAYGAGWTWPGVLHFAIVRDNRLAAASATGFLQTGVAFGAAGGPLAFGLLVESTSYRVAWVATAVLTLLAAITIRTGRRVVRHSRGMHTPRPFRDALAAARRPTTDDRSRR